jgi:nucleoside-diphosphate-sugar epimerase
MVTDYVTPMDKTYALLSKPKISLEQGVRETVAWLKSQPGYNKV